MNIAQIKSELKVVSLPMKWSTNKVGDVSEEWLRCWDNTNKQDIHMHMDVSNAIKAGAETLELQQEVKQGPKGEYTFVRIINCDAVIVH